jgi:hypothetical protein
VRSLDAVNTTTTGVLGIPYGSCGHLSYFQQGSQFLTWWALNFFSPGLPLVNLFITLFDVKLHFPIGSSRTKSGHSIFYSCKISHLDVQEQVPGGFINPRLMMVPLWNILHDSNRKRYASIRATFVLPYKCEILTEPPYSLHILGIFCKKKRNHFKTTLFYLPEFILSNVFRRAWSVQVK